MTSNDHTEVGGLSRSTRSTGASAELRSVVRHIDTEAMQVVQDQAVLQTGTTEVTIQQAAVFVLQHLNEHGVNDQPATLSVHKLCIQQTTHTGNHSQRGHSSSGNASSAGEARCQWDGVTSRTSASQVAEVRTAQFHGSQQFVGTSGGNSFSAGSSGTGGVAVSMLSRLLEASQIRQHVLVVVVTQTIGSAVRCHLHKVHMRVSSFDVVDLEGVVVSLINNQSEVFVVEVLRCDLSTTSVGLDANLRLLDDLDGVPHISNFTEVIAVGDVFNGRSFTECKLYLLGIDNWTERAIGQIAVAGCGRKSHFKISYRYIGI